MENTQSYIQIINRVRELSKHRGIQNVSFKTLCEDLEISQEVFESYFSDEQDLVTKVLEQERKEFEQIFVDHDFEGMNAIDILMIVSKEISLKFRQVTPAITLNLKQNYPVIFQEHFDQRINFIFDKIQINIQKGIQQNMYREDLSVELVARLYISRLIDLHNPDFFPTEKFSFEMLFKVMFENFVRSIGKSAGIAYFEDKIKSLHSKVA